MGSNPKTGSTTITDAPAADTPKADGRQRIVDEAAALFLEQGYAATTLRQLADVVGMKAGSLYYHFSSKDELLTEILQRGIEIMQQAFDTASAPGPKAASGPKQIEAHVRAHLAALFENGPYTATHVTTFRTAPPSVRTAIVPVRDAYEARWTALLDNLKTEKAIRADVDTGLARLILFGAMNSSIEWFDAERGNLDHFATQLTQQFWSGVSA